MCVDRLWKPERLALVRCCWSMRVGESFPHFLLYERPSVFEHLLVVHDLPMVTDGFRWIGHDRSPISRCWSNAVGWVRGSGIASYARRLPSRESELPALQNLEMASVRVVTCEVFIFSWFFFVRVIHIYFKVRTVRAYTFVYTYQ